MKKGRLLVIPQINIAADKSNSRTSAIGDLSCAFPRTKTNPIAGSLSRAVSLQLGTRGMEVETSNKQPLSLRIKQHEAAVLAKYEAVVSSMFVGD